MRGDRVNEREEMARGTTRGRVKKERRERERGNLVVQPSALRMASEFHRLFRPLWYGP